MNLKIDIEVLGVEEEVTVKKRHTAQNVNRDGKLGKKGQEHLPYEPRLDQQRERMKFRQKEGVAQRGRRPNPRDEGQK